MKILLFWLPLLVGLPSLLAGCQPPDPTTSTTQVSGRVVDSQRQRPVPNATIVVCRTGPGGGFLPVGTSYPADTQGRFSFHFEATDKQGYLLLASAPPGYTTPLPTATRLTTGRRNDNLLLPMLAPAWIKIHLVDEPPKTRAVIYLSGYEDSGDTLYYPRDTVLVRPVLGGFLGKIIWGINETGVIQQHDRDVKIPALDTVTVRIPF